MIVPPAPVVVAPIPKESEFWNEEVQFVIKICIGVLLFVSIAVCVGVYCYKKEKKFVPHYSLISDVTPGVSMESNDDPNKVRIN